MSARLLSGPLQTERLPDGRRVLLRDLVTDLGERLEVAEAFDGFDVYAPDATKATAPKGFDTDYSSIPRLARAFMGRWDKHDLAGVFHDLAYRRGVPRGTADRIWRLVARSGDRRINAVQGFMGWAGLRVGGWFAYNRRKREREEQ